MISATYNPVGHRTGVSDPNMGNWTFGYNALGELTSQTDARAIQTTFKYDAIGRRKQKKAIYDIPGVGDASDQVTDTWTYDPPSGFGRGLPYMVFRDVDGAIEREETFDYDALARRTKTTTRQHNGSGGLETFVAHANYDGYYGRLKQIDHPSNEHEWLRYSKYGHLVRTTDRPSGADYRVVNTVDARGQVTSETLGGNLVSDYAFTARTGQMTSVVHRFGSSTLRSIAYQYDVFGNVRRQDLAAPGVATTETFGYDDLHRLTGAGRAGTAIGDVAYGYDEVGNFTYKNDFSTAVAGAYAYTGGSCTLPQVTGSAPVGAPLAARMSRPHRSRLQHAVGSVAPFAGAVKPRPQSTPRPSRRCRREGWSRFHRSYKTCSWIRRLRIQEPPIRRREERAAA